jgi:hypothetical protein
LDTSTSNCLGLLQAPLLKQWTSGSSFCVPPAPASLTTSGCTVGTCPTANLERVLSGCSTKTLDLNQAEAELGSMLLMLTKQPPGKTHGRLDDDEEEPFGVSESELKRTMAFMGLDDSSRENLHAQA